MTFDLHLSPNLKSDEYELWVNRVFTVSSTLNIPYDSIWQMTEYEFLIFENLTKETLEKREKKSQELLDQNG